MSISGISSDPTVSQNYASNPLQQIRKHFAALKTSLKSGDLTAAQNAFATLQKDMQAIGQAQSSQQTAATTATPASSPLDTDLAAIGTALQNGDLQGAQTAFKTLQKDMQQMRQTQGGQQTQEAHRHHHHHHHGGSTQNTQNTASNPFSDLAAISSALQNSDLTGAQQAFATLQQDMGNSSTQTTIVTPGTDLTALGNALQSNDLSGAQNAFATLMQDLQNSLATLGNSTSQVVGTNVDVAT
jgi:hypothetical protein